MELEPVITRLFAADLDEILQNIFLQLDPVSLKACRSVCHQWNHFVKERVWGSIPARKILEVKLRRQWREADTKVRKVDNQSNIYSLTCDNARIYCGTFNGYLEVYCITSGVLLFQRSCLLGEDHKSDVWMPVELDVGESVIACVTNRGEVSVWSKDGKELYKERTHGDGGYTRGGVTVTNRGFVVTGGGRFRGDSTLALIGETTGSGEWGVHQIVNIPAGDELNVVNDLDSDADWLAVATRNGIRMWRLTEAEDGSVRLEIQETRRFLENVTARRLVITFPWVLVVGGGRSWPGLQVWNVETMTLLRHVDSKEGQDPSYYNLQARDGLVSSHYSQKTAYNNFLST